MSYLYRGDLLSVTRPPSRWTDTYLAGRHYASESRSRAAQPDRPAGRFLLSVITGGLRVPACDAPASVRVSGAWTQIPGHVPICLCICPCLSVGQLGPVGPCFLRKQLDASRAQLARSSRGWCVGSGGGTAALFSLACPSGWSAKR